MGKPPHRHSSRGWQSSSGPLLVVIGMVLLELLTVPTGNLPFAEGLRKRAESRGLLGAGLLGFIFALSFCPVSAALFFGSLVPLAVRSGSRVALPSVYGWFSTVVRPFSTEDAPHAIACTQLAA